MSFWSFFSYCSVVFTRFAGRKWTFRLVSQSNSEMLRFFVNTRLLVRRHGPHGPLLSLWCAGVRGLCVGCLETGGYKRNRQTVMETRNSFLLQRLEGAVSKVVEDGLLIGVGGDGSVASEFIQHLIRLLLTWFACFPGRWMNSHRKNTLVMIICIDSLQRISA